MLMQPVSDSSLQVPVLLMSLLEWVERVETLLDWLAWKLILVHAGRPWTQLCGRCDKHPFP